MLGTLSTRTGEEDDALPEVKSRISIAVRMRMRVILIISRSSSSSGSSSSSSKYLFQLSVLDFTGDQSVKLKEIP